MNDYNVQARLSAVDDSYTSTLKKAMGLNDGLFGSIKKIAGGIGVYKMVSGAVNAVKNSVGGAIARFDTLNNYPKVMESMGYSFAEAEKEIKGLGESIEGLPTSLDAITSSAQMFTATLGDMKKGSKTAVALNDMFLSGGQGAEAAGRALTQYNQILAKGKVDQQSWNTLVEVAPAQMNQLAQSLLGASAGQKDLYEALKEGKVSVEEMNDAVVRLDEEGGDGFKSFADQARSATGGIGTSIQNIKTAIVKGVANSITAINDLLTNLGLPTISEMLAKVKDGVNSAFSKINEAIAASQPIFERIIGHVKILKDAFAEAFAAVKKSLGGAFDGIKIEPMKALQAVIDKVGAALQKVAAFIRDNADAFAGLIKALPIIIGAFAGFKIIKKVTGFFGGFKKAAGGVTGATGSMATNIARALAVIPPTTILAIGAALLMVAAGFALIATQGAGAAEIIKGIGSAIAIVFTAVIESLASALPAITTALTTLAPVITTAIGAIVPVITTALATLLPLITDFFATILPIVTSFIETVLPQITAFTTQILSIVTAFVAEVLPPIISGVAQITDIILNGVAAIVTALAPIVESIGQTIQGVADAIARVAETVAPTLESMGSMFESFGESVKAILEGVSEVVTAVGDSISGVLDSVAGIFDSMGNAALNAGLGVEKMAAGIALLVGLSLADLAATLATVADGLVQIGDTSTNVDSVASSMSKAKSAVSSLSSKLKTSATSIKTMATGTTTLSTGLTRVGTVSKTSATTMSTAFKTGATQVKTAMTTVGSAITQELSSVSSRAVGIVRSMMNSLSSAISGGASGVGSAFSGFKSAAISAVSNAISALRPYADQMRRVGSDIGRGLARGMQDQINNVKKVAKELGDAAKESTRGAVRSSSPAKEFIDIGKDIGRGLVIGIDRLVPQVEKAGTRLAYATGFNTDYSLDHNMSMASSFTGSIVTDIRDIVEDIANRPIKVYSELNIDGRAFATAETPYIEDAMGERAKIDNYTKGIKQ